MRISKFDCNHNNIYDFNFAQNPDDYINNSFKSNKTGLSVDLSSSNIDIVNNLDNQIISMCEEASTVNNEDVSDSIKTRDVNTWYTAFI